MVFYGSVAWVAGAMKESTSNYYEDQIDGIKRITRPKRVFQTGSEESVTIVGHNRWNRLV